MFVPTFDQVRSREGCTLDGEFDRDDRTTFQTKSTHETRDARFTAFYVPRYLLNHVGEPNSDGIQEVPRDATFVEEKLRQGADRCPLNFETKLSRASRLSCVTDSERPRTVNESPVDNHEETPRVDLRHGHCLILRGFRVDDLRGKRTLGERMFASGTEGRAYPLFLEGSLRNPIKHQQTVVQVDVRTDHVACLDQSQARCASLDKTRAVT